MTTRLILPIFILLSLTYLQAQIHDLTKTLDFEREGEYHLGPTGAKGWIYTAGNFMTTDARQVLVTAVEKGTPADGKLEGGDVILGIGGKLFSSDARKALGVAIDEAEVDGKLELLCWRQDADSETRKGKKLAVTLDLPVLGSYSDTAPWNCPKSQKIGDKAIQVLLAQKDFDKFGLSALALLATGEKAHLEVVRDFLHEVKWAKPDIHVGLEKGGLVAWGCGFQNLVLAEYYLASGDKYVLPAIREYSTKIAMGQSNAGTWGHGFAWTNINGGKLHGALQGYGAVNQAGLPCFLSLLLAKKCGVEHPEVDAAIERSSQFFETFIGHGSIGYGFHRPSLEINANGRNGMSGNGKNGVAALAFSVHGHKEGTTFFTRLTASLYNTMEYGHSGNSYSYFWDPLGVNCGGPDMVAAFLKQLRWYYALTRKADGSFVNQQLGGVYGRPLLNPTAVQALIASFPKRAIYLTGKGLDEKDWLSKGEAQETIGSGRWRLEDPADLCPGELIGELDDWSPIAREWVAKHLAKKEGDFVPELTKLLESDKPEARAGACAALGHLRSRAKSTVPLLAKALVDEEAMVGIAAGYALARMGKDARPAIPTLLKALLDPRETSPMKPRRQALAYALGYANGRYAPLYFDGILPQFRDGGDPLEGIDRELLYSSLKELLTDSSGRTRSSAAYAFNYFTKEDTAMMAQSIYDVILTPALNYKMMDGGARARGLELLARLNIEEGLSLCWESFDLNRWGMVMRAPARLKTFQAYGGNAKPYLPKLKELRNKWKKGETRELLDKTIRAIEDSTAAPGLVSLHDLVEVRFAMDLENSGSDGSSACEIRDLMAKYPEDGFYQAAGLRKLVALLGKDAKDDVIKGLSGKNGVFKAVAEELWQSFAPKE